MPGQAWEVTREMFLDEQEVRALLGAVRNAVTEGRPAAVETREPGPLERPQAVARLDQLIVECLLFSGLRNSELCRLTRRDTFLGHGERAFYVRGPRGNDRVVSIPSALNDLVLAYAEEVRPLFLPQAIRPSDLDPALIFNEHRQPYERTGLYRRVVRILTAAGLGERASVQLLRHTYGYLAYLRTGGNLLFVQRQLGHAHPMVTIVYAKFVEESYAELANKVGEPAARTSRV